MGRRTALVAIALVVLGAAACGNQDDAEGSEEPVVTGEIDQAVEIAQLSLPAAVTDDLAADLIESLCAAAGSGAVDPVVAQLQASALDPADAPAALDALAAGAGTYCPDDVDDVVPQVQQALIPATTATTAAPSVAPAGGTSSRSSSSSGTGTTTGGTSGGSSNSSTGAASAGGGNASGTGNSSSTDFSQGVGSSNSSSAGGGSASSSSTTG